MIYLILIAILLIIAQKFATLIHDFFAQLIKLSQHNHTDFY